MKTMNGLEASRMLDRKYGSGVSNVFFVNGRPVRSRFSPDDVMIVGMSKELTEYTKKIRSMLSGADVS